MMCVNQRLYIEYTVQCVRLGEGGQQGENVVPKYEQSVCAFKELTVQWG